jgi:hypothetical protein
MTFLEELHKQRWDDHRFYHHNRINQTLHLVSASCFLASYVLIFFDPVAAVMVSWVLAMVLRQIGHFFFEPKTFDDINGVSPRVQGIREGRLQPASQSGACSVSGSRSRLLSSCSPTSGGCYRRSRPRQGLLYNTSVAWFFVGIGAVLFRTVHLFFLMGVQSGLVWATKILTDPFHDIFIYHRAPAHLLRGEMYDDMTDWYAEVPGAKA